MGKKRPKDNMPNPLPKSCRACTRYLNEVLPKPSCYTSCPKNNPVGDIESSLSLSTRTGAAFEVCPLCNTKALRWRKDALIYECLRCHGSWTVNALKIARYNAEWRGGDGGYLQARDGYDS